MIWIYYFLLLVVALGGLLLAIFMLPGLWLMLAAAAVYAMVSHRAFVGNKTLIALLLLAGLAEVSDVILGGAGAKRAGASGWGILGGFVGAIIGGIFLSVVPIPIVSTVIGICLGSFLGASSVELIMGQGAGASIRIGYGTAKGRFIGIVCKMTLGVVMLLIVIWKGLPIHI
jgi:uncharacterized protein YqgC (DUF456 family)